MSKSSSCPSTSWCCYTRRNTATARNHHPTTDPPPPFPPVPDVPIVLDPTSCSHPFLRVSQPTQCVDCKTILDPLSAQHTHRFDIEKQWLHQIQTEEERTAQDVERHGAMVHRCGVSVKWLLAFTHKHDLWEWPTWKVNRLIIKPATMATRCRYAHLPEMKPFVGPATVFLSHCWGAPFKDVVTASMANARNDRFVWLDIFAVRQWTGRDADLCFEHVIKRCQAMIVSISLHQDLRPEKPMTPWELHALYQEKIGLIRRKVSVWRLWCIVEMAAALAHQIPLIVWSGTATGTATGPATGTATGSTATGPATCSATGTATGIATGTARRQNDHQVPNYDRLEGMQLVGWLLRNVDIRTAGCSSEIDRDFHFNLMAQKHQDIYDVNYQICKALVAAHEATAAECTEVEAAMCGEPEALHMLMDTTYKSFDNASIVNALRAAVAYGQSTLVSNLLDLVTVDHVERWSCGTEGHYRRLVWTAVQLDHVGICRQLLVKGISAHQFGGDNAETTLSVAVMNESVEMVVLLLEHGASFESELGVELGMTHWYDEEDGTLEEIWERLLRRGTAGEGGGGTCTKETKEY